MGRLETHYEARLRKVRKQTQECQHLLDVIVALERGNPDRNTITTMYDGLAREAKKLTGICQRFGEDVEKRNTDIREL